MFNTTRSSGGKGNNNNRSTPRIVAVFIVLILASVGWNTTVTMLQTPRCGDPSHPDLPLLKSSAKITDHAGGESTIITKNAEQRSSYMFDDAPISNPVWRKWQDSTVVATLSFGNATKTKLAERLIWSLRTNGDWNGRFVIITDNHTHYENTMKGFNVQVLAAKPQDLHPVVDGTRLEFKKDAMRFKRFKTLLLDYCKSPAISPFDHLLYMDMDIVVTRSLPSFLQDYQDQMIRRETFQNAHTLAGNETTKPFLSMFSDCATCAKRNTNSGVILMHRTHSLPCLLEWKRLFDAGASWASYDQRHLRDIHDVCKIYKLPESHRLYPTWKDMRTKISATFVHNTNSYNALKIPARVQKEYFEYLLNTTAFSELEHF